jgi:hypothetical protein
MSPMTIYLDLTLPHQVSRMMMNIRGLILDDPEHTTYLQTLQFVTVTNSDSGTELEVVHAR